MFDNITENRTPFVISHTTRMKMSSFSPKFVTNIVTDLNNGVTTSYPSARNAALALNCSNSTIMNKLKALAATSRSRQGNPARQVGKNSKIYCPPLFFPP